MDPKIDVKRLLQGISTEFKAEREAPYAGFIGSLTVRLNSWLTSTSLGSMLGDLMKKNAITAEELRWFKHEELEPLLGAHPHGASDASTSQLFRRTIHLTDDPKVKEELAKCLLPQAPHDIEIEADGDGLHFKFNENEGYQALAFGLLYQAISHKKERNLIDRLEQASSILLKKPLPATLNVDTLAPLLQELTHSPHLSQKATQALTNALGITIILDSNPPNPLPYPLEPLMHINLESKNRG